MTKQGQQRLLEWDAGSELHPAADEDRLMARYGGMVGDLGVDEAVEPLNAVEERDAHQVISAGDPQIVAFLYVADEDEDEATPLADLQHRAGLSTVQAWRTARALGEEDGLGLVTQVRWKTRNALALRLSPAGEALCERLDLILRRAQPVAPRRIVLPDVAET